MGLTQAALARLAGLSRQTVNQVENGTAADLSLGRASRLAEVLGLRLQVDASIPPMPARGSASAPLSRAARTASVSYRDSLPLPVLRRSLLAGKADPGWMPQLHALVDEAPVSLLAAVVEQLHRESGRPRDSLWAGMRAIARELSSLRAIWS